MSKAAQLGKRLESLGRHEGIKTIEEASANALYFNVIGDAMCLMHDDGSVNIIEIQGHGVVTTEVISPESILKVLHHYRPFKEVFKGMVQ